MDQPSVATAPDETLKVLSARYGFARVRSGDVFLDMLLENGGTFLAVLTWDQAKYLATNPLRAEDLRDSNKLPPDWPKT